LLVVERGALLREVRFAPRFNPKTGVVWECARPGRSFPRPRGKPACTGNFRTFPIDRAQMQSPWPSIGRSNFLLLTSNFGFRV